MCLHYAMMMVVHWWCDLGCCSWTVMVIEAAANLCLSAGSATSSGLQHWKSNKENLHSPGHLEPFRRHLYINLPKSNLCFANYWKYRSTILISICILAFCLCKLLFFLICGVELILQSTLVVAVHSSLPWYRDIDCQVPVWKTIFFFSCAMMFFSKWLVLSSSSGPGHIPIAWSQTPAAWHMVQHSLVLLSASNYKWMCLVSLCIQDAPLCIWLVLKHFLFSR